MADRRWRDALARRVRPADVLLSFCLMALALLLGWLALSGLREPDMGMDAAGASSPTTGAPAALDISEVAQYIDEHFSGAAWYPTIVGYEPVEPRGVAVLTTLRRDESEQAVGICRAVSFWRPGDDLIVVVRATDETPLAESPRGDNAKDCRARDKEELPTA